MMLSSGIFASALRKPLFDRPFTAPKGMCGFRLERSAYSGSNIIRLREDAGDTEANIGFAPSGYLDEAAAVAHLAGAGGFVDTVWDQVDSNAADIIQNTNSLQPSFVPNGYAGLSHLHGDGAQWMTVNGFAVGDVWAFMDRSFTAFGLFRGATTAGQQRIFSAQQSTSSVTSQMYVAIEATTGKLKGFVDDGGSNSGTVTSTAATAGDGDWHSFGIRVQSQARFAIAFDDEDWVEYQGTGNFSSATALGAAAILRHQVVDRRDRLLVRGGAGVEHVALALLALVLEIGRAHV